MEDETFSEIAVEDCDDARKLGEEVSEIDNILSVEKVEHFSKCVNCTRKLVQVTSENIVQCDRRGHSMRLSQCERSIALIKCCGVIEFNVEELIQSS